MRLYVNHAPWFRYGLAVVAVILAVLVILLVPVIKETGRGALLPFFFAVVVTSYWLGIYPGMLAMSLSLIAVNVLVLKPVWLNHPAEATTLNLGFCALSVVIFASARSQHQLIGALTASQKHLKLAQSVSQLGSWHFDALSKQLFWSEENYKIFGLPSTLQPTYELFLAKVHPDDQSYVNERWQAALHGEPYDIEHRIVVDGNVRWLHQKAILDFDQQGKLLGGQGTTQDISTQKQFEHALQTLLTRYELVLNGAQDGLWDWDVVTDQVHYSSRWKTLRGYDVDENLHEVSTWRDNIHPDDEDRIMAAMKLHFDGKTEVFNEEYRIRCKDGTWKWISDRGLAKRNEFGQIIRMAGSETDITDRKQAEIALRDSEERLRLAQQAGELGIFDHDLVHNTIQVDHRLRELWGLQPDEAFTLSSFFSSVHPDDHDFIKAAVRRAGTIKDGGDYHTEYRLIRPTDQQLFWVATFGTVTFTDGKPTRIVGFVQDISARKRAEAQLLDTETRLSLALEELKAGFWDWELDSNQVFYSPVWKRQLGYAEHEISNHYQEWEQRLHPDDKAQTLATTQRYLDGQIPDLDLEFRLQHKDGSYRTIHSRGALIRDKVYLPRRLIGIHLDITDFKNTQKLHLRRDQIEDSFRLNLVIQTVAAIAHELNQPLAAISLLAYGSLAMAQSGNPDPDKLIKALENCSEQAQRAGEVIRQLMSVLEKGEIESKASDINQAVKSTLNLIKLSRLFHGCRLRLKLADNLPLVAAPDLHIEKVLLIILNNALEAIAENPTSLKTIAVTSARSTHDPALAQITVTDSGIGVADTGLLKNLFKPFYTTKTKGLGMGLAISRALVEAHGGKIWAEANPDAGISVHFTLPFCP